MSGLGIESAVEMGGHFVDRLKAAGLDSKLDALYVLYGEAAGAPGSVYETDGMSCPTCAVNGDGVLFKKSIAAIDTLTSKWSTSKRSRDAKQESVALGHLEVGATPVGVEPRTHLPIRPRLTQLPSAEAGDQDAD
jgi:hypothetical protein